MASLILLAGGLVLLAAGGEVLIRGAVLLARLAGLSAAVIGLTVVAAGTSLPELAVSLEAALRGGADLAVANVIGSNILNISFALGLTALLSPLPVHSTAIRLEWPVMFGSAVVCTAMLADSWLSRGEAALLVLALVARSYAREAALKIATEGLQWSIGAGQTDPNFAHALNLPGIYQVQAGLIEDMDFAAKKLVEAFPA